MDDQEFRKQTEAIGRGNDGALLWDKKQKKFIRMDDRLNNPVDSSVQKGKYSSFWTKPEQK